MQDLYFISLNQNNTVREVVCIHLLTEQHVCCVCGKKDKLTWYALDFFVQAVIPTTVFCDQISSKKNLTIVKAGSENLNTRPLVRKQVDFLADKLIFQQLARWASEKLWHYMTEKN